MTVTLLNNSMIDALSRQKAGPPRDRIYQNIMAEYMLVSRPQINLAQVTTSIPNSPAVSRPNSANASMAPMVGLFKNALLSNAASHEGSLGSRPAASAHHVSGINLAALTLSGGSSAVCNDMFADILHLLSFNKMLSATKDYCDVPSS